jgi:hypothetical protein
MLRKILPQQLRTRSFTGVLPMNHKSTLCSEPFFNHMLRLEEKRSARSGNPILLALLDVSNHLEPPRGSGVLQKLEKALSSNFRETDLKGWFRESSVIGIVFTEMGSINERMKSKMLLKIHQALHDFVGPEEDAAVETSLHLLPLSHGDLTGFGKEWKEHGHRHLEAIPKDETVESISGGGILGGRNGSGAL